MARCVWALADEEITKHFHCSDEGRAREWLAMMISAMRTRLGFLSPYGRYGMQEERLFMSKFIKVFHGGVLGVKRNTTKETSGEAEQRAPSWIPPL
jgi:hypothetical protein